VRDFKGPPVILELNKFKRPGYFSEFSRAKYLRVLDREDAIAKINPMY
jgi:hypothetical protein